MDRSDAPTGERGSGKSRGNRSTPSDRLAHRKGARDKGRLAPSKSGTEDPLDPPAPPIGTVKPIRDVPDEYVFRFELGPAILAQLLETLRHIPPSPISQAIIDAKYPGFYQIFLDGKPVYVGRTTRRIGARLGEHVRKLQGRIDLKRVTSKYAFVEDPSLVDVSEHALIEYFAEHGLALWNTSGFGSKVSGYGRGRQSTSKWAAKHPPDLNLPITAGSDTQPTQLNRLIRAVGSKAPITFSIPKKHRRSFNEAHAEPIQIAKEQKSFTEWVEFIERTLEPGWTIDRQPLSWYVVPSA